MQLVRHKFLRICFWLINLFKGEEGPLNFPITFDSVSLISEL